MRRAQSNRARVPSTRKKAANRWLKVIPAGPGEARHDLAIAEWPSRTAAQLIATQADDKLPGSRRYRCRRSRTKVSTRKPAGTGRSRSRSHPSSLENDQGSEHNAADENQGRTEMNASSSADWGSNTSAAPSPASAMSAGIITRARISNSRRERQSQRIPIARRR